MSISAGKDPVCAEEAEQPRPNEEDGAERPGK